MKKTSLLVVLVYLKISSFSQSISRESIEERFIGWMKIGNFKGAKEPLKIDDKLYSIAQLSICDSFANWMQASYTPKGSLGEVRKSVSEKLGPYNQYLAARPPSYGAFVKTYTELGYDAKRKIIPLSNSHLVWSMMANGMYGYPAEVLCTANQYYFMLPSFEEQGYNRELEDLYDLSEHPVLKKYPAYYIRNSVTGNQKMVILTKDYQLPFVKITRGEYLRAAEEAVMRLYETEKKKIYESEKNDQRKLDYSMSYLDDKQRKRLACLQNNKEKYKERLQEEAAIFTLQPDVLLENYPDVFEGNGGSGLKLPVYKVDAAAAARCKTDNPQWILITWTADIRDPAGKQLQEAVLNNFNFEYVYNFFFNPGKVKQQRYQPLRSPLYTEAVVVNEASAATKKNETDKSIYFFEDFSITVPGKTPVGWKSNLGYSGKGSVVTLLDGLQGNWAVIKDHRLLPTQLKFPLPQEFTLSFDLVVTKGFAWGSKALSINLTKGTAPSPANAESFLQLRLRPGDGGRNGEASIEAKFPDPPGYANGTKWFKIPGFSNDKTINRISIMLKKSEEQLQLFIDDHLVAEYEKALPAAHLFNGLSFESYNQEDKNAYYISNVRISKK